MTLIKVKDEDFEEIDILVENNPEASEQLRELINNYNCFQEIIDFIYDNFKVIDVDIEEYEV